MAIAGVDQVISFELDERNVAILGHDHPSSLNKALRGVAVSSLHVTILDSDCFPLQNTWLETVERAGALSSRRTPQNTTSLTHV